MTKISITESEKQKILEMYNLITEDVDQELLDYGNNYIDNNDCKQIYRDLVKFQSAANSGQVQMSSEDKEELDDNLKKMKNFMGFPGACATIKKEMKKSFAEQAQQNPEKLKSSMCWFAENISKPSTPLKSCSSTEVSTQTTATPVDNTTTQTTATPSSPTTTVDNVTTTPQGTETPAQTGAVDIDYKLDTPEKIQEFQTWMDKNHGKWAYSKKYNKSYSVDGKPNKGFGNMGPNTKKAWNNEEYKNAYLKEKGLVKKETSNVTNQQNTNKTENVSQPLVKSGGNDIIQIDDL
jgi:hypothetical protein